MDIAEMRRIPIADFLARLGHGPVRRSGNELWYSAPYRTERTPSFRVNTDKNVWYDFGLGKGGDIFNLAGEFIHSKDFMAQARFISETVRVPMLEMDAGTCRKKTLEPSFEDVRVMPLRYVALKRYLEERGIPPDTASLYCSQLNYHVHKKEYFAIGFPNVAGGYELRSGLFKGCVPPKDVSLVRTGESPSDGCNVFEGFMDFLSAVALKWTEDEDSLVLNSVANVARSYKYLNKYKKIRCYLDRDEAGRRALESLRSRYSDRITDRSNLYDGCKDLNEYLQRSVEKTINNHLKIK
ncbi:MAG: toprim domain-containing protein [Paraprevotella clara]